MAEESAPPKMAAETERALPRFVWWPVVAAIVGIPIALGIAVGLVSGNAYLVALVLFLEGLALWWWWGLFARKVDRELRTEGSDGLAADDITAAMDEGRVITYKGVAIRMAALLAMFLLFPLSLVALVIAIFLE